jgi:hypothetical protein
MFSLVKTLCSVIVGLVLVFLLSVALCFTRELNPAEEEIETMSG